MDFLLKYRRLWLLGLLGMSVLFGVFLFRITINFSFESFYVQGDPEFQYYDEHRRLFGEAQNYMLCVALKSPGDDIFDRAFLEEADSLFQALAALPRIDSAVLGTRLAEIRRTPLGSTRRPYLQFEDEAALAASRARLQADTSLIGSIVSQDFTYVYAYFFIEPEIFDTPERDALNRELEARLQASGQAYVITGIPYIRTQYIKKIGNELLLFLSLSAVLIISILYATYRNVWGVVIPVMAVIVALVWILGLMGMTGASINLLSNLLIPIIFVVGISDVVHLITKYLSEVQQGVPRGKALKTTLYEIGFAIFLTSLTTAIGFGSLVVSRLPPIRSFGLYAAIGVMFTYLIAVVVIPAALLALPKEGFMSRAAFGNLRFWKGFLLTLYRLTTHRQKEILIASGLVLLACVYLIFQIPTNTYLIEDLSESDPVRQDMSFFEQKSYGIRPFDMGIHAKGGHRITDREVLEELDKFQAFIREQERFGPFISIVNVVKEAYYVDRFNRERYRRIPERQEKIDELVELVRVRGGEGMLESLLAEDGQRARLSSRVPDIGTDAFAEIYARIDSFYQQEMDTTLFDYRFTGHAFLTEHNLTYLRNSLMLGLLIAFLVIGLIMGLLFRSWRMLLVSMVPNVIPLVLTGGVMGLFGITLSASTAIVFVVAFGIAVDDTIHFLTRFRLEISKGNHLDVAIRNTILGTGKAMLLTSLVLLGGFVVLTASNFGGTFSTGLFTALTIVFALLSDLLLLPILLRFIAPAFVKHQQRVAA